MKFARIALVACVGAALAMSVPAAAAAELRHVEQQRDTDHSVVVHEVLEHQPVVAEEVAVVAGECDRRTLG